MHTLDCKLCIGFFLFFFWSPDFYHLLNSHPYKYERERIISLEEEKKMLKSRKRHTIRIKWLLVKTFVILMPPLAIPQSTPMRSYESRAMALLLTLG